MLFLDCEFNGHGGELISIGIAGTECFNDFYEVVSIPTYPHVWVRDNVLPFLMKAPIGYNETRSRLIQFLNNLPGETICADWPADFTHFLAMLHRPNDPAYAWGTHELTLKLLRRGEYSFVPVHNAHEDAKLLRDAYVAANT